MTQPRVTVLAGSARFTSSLAELITKRLGERPRVVADPGQAFALCRGSTGLLVLEFDPRWTNVLRDLGAVASRLRVVAAVPPAAADAAAPLGGLGVFAVPWVGDPAAVLGAIEVAPAQAEEPAAPSLAPRAGPAAAPSAFFGDVGAEVPAHPGGATRATEAGSANGAARPAPPPAWPANVSSEYEAEQVLCAALSGLKAAGDAALDATLAVLTDVERRALAGDATLADAEPFRSAAALRYRVSSALASAPAPGSPVDPAAGSALLAEIDAVLARLKGAADGGESLDAIRKALVHEAVDLSEALHRLQPAGPAAAAPAAPAARATAVSTARVLSNEAERADASARRWPLWGALAAALLAALGYHLRHFLLRPDAPPPSFAGAPAGAAGLDHGGSKILTALPGKPLDPAQLEQFRQLEEARGNRVEEVSPGMWVVRPGPSVPAAQGGNP